MSSSGHGGGGSACPAARSVRRAIAPVFALAFALACRNIEKGLQRSRVDPTPNADRPHRPPRTKDDAPANVSARIGGGPDRAGVRLCGCGVCASVRFHVGDESSGGSDAAAGGTAVRFEFLEPPPHLPDGWYDAALLGSAGVYASPIATNPEVADGMPDSIAVGVPGRYRIHLSPSHNSTVQALGLGGRSQVSVPGEACPLVIEGEAGAEKYPLVEVPSVRPAGQDGLDGPRWVVAKNSSHCDYDLYFDPNEKNFPLCFRRGTKDYCSQSKAANSANATGAILLGDSHTDKLAQVLFQLHPDLEKERGWMATKYHGSGIYLNRAPHYRFGAYVAGKEKADFVEGKMLANLRTGRYRSLQMERGFATWFFQSGHWDLRDATLDDYRTRLAELFREFAAFRDRFRASPAPLRLVWLGLPAYSHKRDMWGGMEMRTNVKLALADRAAARAAREHGAEALPFFDLTYPLYRQSCDSHHYVCPGQANGREEFRRENPLGHEFMELLLEVSRCLP